MSGGSANGKFVWTWGVWQWDDQRGEYVLEEREGFYYDGPWALAHDVAPTWTQVNYRWRNDDGTSATATWATAENTSLTTGVEPGDTIRLRIDYAETAGAAGTGSANGFWTLQVDKNTGGYANVSAQSDVTVTNIANITNGNEVAQQLGGAGAAFASAAGGMFDTQSNTNNFDGWSKTGGEVEFALQFAAGNSSADSFTFRLLSPNSTVPAITNTPTISLSSAEPAGEVTPSTGAPSGQAVGSPADLYNAVVINPTGVASNQAVGSPTLALGALVYDFAPSIDSQQAVGSPTVANAEAGDAQDLTVNSGAPSAAAVGTPDHHITLSGVASNQAVGSPTVTSPASELIVSSGVASNQAVGSPTVTSPASELTVNNGVGSSQAVGTPIVEKGQRDITCASGAPSAQAVGSPVVAEAGEAAELVVSTGAPSAQAVGSPTVLLQSQDIIVSNGVGSSQAVGSPTVEKGQRDITAATGAPSAQAVGSPTVENAAADAPQELVVSNGVASNQAVGTPNVSRPALTYDFAPSIDSQAAVGSPTLSQGTDIVCLTGAPSAQAVGSPALDDNPPSTLTYAQEVGIESQQAVGSPTTAIAPQNLIISSGVASNQAVGSPNVSEATKTFTAKSIDSQQAIGSPSVTDRVINIGTGAPSAQGVGSPTVESIVAQELVVGTGAPSAQAVGSPKVANASVITPTGVASNQAVGSPKVFPAQFIVANTGAPSAQAVGSPRLRGSDGFTVATGAPSAQAVGSPDVREAQLDITINTGAPSAQAVGSPSVDQPPDVGVVFPSSGAPSAQAVGSPTVEAEPEILDIVAGTGAPSSQAVGSPKVFSFPQELIVNSGPPDYTERLAPDAITAEANLTGDVTDIQDDPDDPDSDWLTAPQNASINLRVSFATPAVAPTVAEQEFRVLLRKTAINNNKANDSYTISLYSGSTPIATLATGGNLPTGGVVISAKWDVSLISDFSTVECLVVGTPEGGGSPSTRGSVEVGAIEWNVDSTPTNVGSPTLAQGLEGNAQDLICNTGAPSAQAVGTPAKVFSSPQALTANTGAPSAQAVGSPKVDSSTNVIDINTGAPSSQAVGSPDVSVQGAAAEIRLLYGVPGADGVDPGLPEGPGPFETVGSPDVLVGVRSKGGGRPIGVHHLFGEDYVPWTWQVMTDARRRAILKRLGLEKKDVPKPLKELKSAERKLGVPQPRKSRPKVMKMLRAQQVAAEANARRRRQQKQATQALQALMKIS